MRRLLRSTAIILALGFFIPAPNPVTGIVFNPAAYADPYTGKIPDWIKSACCGPEDAHRLTMANVQEVDGVEAQRLRPISTPAAGSNYYIIDGYGQPIYSQSTSVNPGGVSSQDQYVWAFYAEGRTLAGGDTSQSAIYCLFLPENF